jgi:hypothetical protein
MENRLSRLEARLTNSEMEMLRQLSRRSGLSISDVLRKLISESFAIPADRSQHLRRLIGESFDQRPPSRAPASAQRRGKKASANILEVLRGHLDTDGMSTRDVQIAVLGFDEGPGYARDRIRKVLSRMAARGTIERVSRGVWRALS